MNLDYQGGVVANRRAALDVAETSARQAVVVKRDVAAKGFPLPDTLVSGRDVKLMASPLSVRFDRPLVPAWTARVHRGPKDDWYWSCGFAFAPNRSIVTTGGEGRIETWDLATGKPRSGFTINDPVHVGDCIGVDGHGRIATDGYQHDRQSTRHPSVPLFWTPDGGRMGEIDLRHGHWRRLNSLAWLPDGRLATSCYEGSLQVWERSGEHVRTLCERGPVLNAIAVLPTGRVIGGAEGGSVRIWNPTTGECERTVDHGYNAVAVGVGPNGTFFSAGSHSCKLWGADGTLIAATEEKSGGLLGGAAVAADGTMLTSNGALNVFDARGKQTQWLRDARAIRIAIAPSGALVTASRDGTLTRWTNP